MPRTELNIPVPDAVLPGQLPEAIREVMRHAFETVELDALWCGYFDNNVQSQRVQAKCGFRRHHTEENKYNSFLQDRRTEHISRITREEWFAQQ